eukprot:360465-Chlamydomonas_euryale.AAC.1
MCGAGQASRHQTPGKAGNRAHVHALDGPGVLLELSLAALQDVVRIRDCPLGHAVCGLGLVELQAESLLVQQLDALAQDLACLKALVFCRYRKGRGKGTDGMEIL